MHVAALTIHTIAALVALAAGLVVVAEPRRVRSQALFDVYVLALCVMTVALIVAIGIDWSDLESGARVAFVALAALAVGIVWAGGRARRLRGRPQAMHSMIELAGFTLIALFDGFVIVTAIDAGAPGWLVGVVAVAGVLFGRRLVALAHRRAEQTG
jgi:hypothetical protein